MLIWSTLFRFTSSLDDKFLQPNHYIHCLQPLFNSFHHLLMLKENGEEIIWVNIFVIYLMFQSVHSGDTPWWRFELVANITVHLVLKEDLFKDLLEILKCIKICRKICRNVPLWITLNRELIYLVLQHIFLSI